MRDCRANKLETLRLAMHPLVRGKIPMRVLRTKEATRLVFPVADGSELGFPHLMRAAKKLDRRGTLSADLTLRTRRAYAVFAMGAKFMGLFEVLIVAASPLLR